VIDRSCLVCGGEFSRARIAGLLECKRCGFVSADVTLTYEELSRLYSSRYFCGEEYRDYFAERHLIERQFRNRLRTLLRFVQQPEHRRLFEIGAAYGFFLSVAAEVFGRVEGIDISADAAAAARDLVRVPVATGDFLDALVMAPLDVVCLWDTIEHLAHPELYIQKAAALMPPGSVIVISTGDIESVVARTRGARWRQIHPPTHLHYFSRETLTRLLDAHGFEVCHVEYDGIYRSVATMAFMILAIRHRQERIYRWLERTRLLNWTVYLNLYDTMVVVATKRP
jgi:SAM-dependent methyltransferase